MNKCFLPIALLLSICCNAVHGCNGREYRDLKRFYQREVLAFVDIINHCVENQLDRLDDIRLRMLRTQVHETKTGGDVLLHLIDRYVMSVLVNAEACADFSRLTDEQVDGFRFVYGLFCDDGEIVIPVNLHNNSQLFGVFFWLVLAIKEATDICLKGHDVCRTDNQCIAKHSQVFQCVTQAFESAVNSCNIEDRELLYKFVNAVEVIRFAYVDNFRRTFMID